MNLLRRSLYRLILSSLCLNVVFNELTVAQAQVPKKKVLILGDSISIGYTPYVKESLADQALVIRPKDKLEKPVNCNGTTFGVEKIDSWLAQDGGNWDLIHFNFGLHDLKHVQSNGVTGSDLETDPPQATVEVYETQLKTIVGKLKKTNAKLIFATTTPVPDGKVRPWRTDVDVVKYNEVAKKIMQENDIPVNDLYEFCKPKLAEIQLPANVHFNEAGSKRMANQVAQKIAETLQISRKEIP